MIRVYVLMTTNRLCTELSTGIGEQSPLALGAAVPDSATVAATHKRYFNRTLRIAHLTR